jgi:hypothetical protein
MLKSKNNQNSGCTYIYETSRKGLNSRRLLARKLVATVFWDRKGVLMAKFIKQGATKKNCIGPFRKKRRGKLTSSVVLLHDNARPYRSTSCSYSSTAAAFQLGVV